MELRSPSSSVNYSDESKDYTDFNADSIRSTSQWKNLTVKHLNIKVSNVSTMLSSPTLNEEAKQLIVPEWKNGDWLLSKEIESIQHANRVKSLFAKIREVYIAGTTITEMYVDGFMSTLLQIVGFDDYPCLLYPQYSYSAQIGPLNHTINAKTDFSVISHKRQIMIVIENKTTSNANRTNNWKEDQVLGELFVAVHKATEYPAIVYAVRVVGTLFTFYKTVATADYILESAKLGKADHNEMVVQRYPPVENSPILTAYDICNGEDRIQILECLCSIRRSII